MRVLHVLGGLNQGGIETWLRHIILHTPPGDIKMDLAVCSQQDSPLRQELLAAGCKIYHCPRQSRPWELAWNLYRILHRQGPYDVVHSHFHRTGAAAVCAAKLAGVPVRVLHAHIDSSAVDEQASLRQAAANAILDLAGRWAATGGVAASLKAGDSLFGPAWVDPPAWQVLHCGIDLAAFSENVDSQAIRQSLGIPPHAFVVGHVGRFTAQKNHGFLIDIAGATIRQNPRAFFLLVGEGPLRGAMEQRIREERLTERVKIIGPRTDVPRLMLGAFDAFCLPSRYEGLPLVLMEAQAAGLPCVIADVISAEADLLPTIHRLSIQVPEGTWAAALNRCRDLKWDTKHSLQVMRKSDFDLTVAMEEIQAYWRTMITRLPRSAVVLSKAAEVLE